MFPVGEVLKGIRWIFIVIPGEWVVGIFVCAFRCCNEGILIGVCAGKNVNEKKNEVDDRYISIGKYMYNADY